MSTNKEVALKSYDISAPSEMAKMANTLKTHIVKNNLFTTIANKNYAHVEGWQFAGGLMGIFPRVVKVENLSNEKEKKWSAEVEIVRMKDNVVVGRGYAICSNTESKRKTADEYVILSMAQTRAIGKAYRNLIGWVMKLAGYEGTPKEEMVKAGETEPAPEAHQPDTPKSDKTIDTCMGPKCGEILDATVAAYSKRVYGKTLCRAHQPKRK